MANEMLWVFVSFWDCGLSICLKKTYGPSAMRHNHEPPWHLLGKVYKSKLIFLNASCFETNATFQFAVKSHLFRLITKTWVASKTYEWFIQMAGHCTNISKKSVNFPLPVKTEIPPKPHAFFLWNIPCQVAIMSSLTIRKGNRWGRLRKKTAANLRLQVTLPQNLRENQHFSGYNELRVWRKIAERSRSRALGMIVWLVAWWCFVKTCMGRFFFSKLAGPRPPLPPQKKAVSGIFLAWIVSPW